MRKPLLDEFDRHCVREGFTYGKYIKRAIAVARLKRELDRFIRPKVVRILDWIVK